MSEEVKNKTRQDAWERITAAKRGYLVRPTIPFLEAIRSLLIEWQDEVNEQIHRLEEAEHRRRDPT